MRLAGKVALVTGAGRGIGRATALKLAGEGARLVVNDLDDAAEEVAAAIRAGGGEAAACIGSVTEDGFAERFVRAATDRFGGLDILVNNAGFQWDAPIEEASDEQLDLMLAVHARAQFRILRAAIAPIRAMRARERAEGRAVTRKVVNVSSMSATDGSAGQVPYATAKAAVIGLTLSLAKDWGRYGVCVNCVAFGTIDTRLVRPFGGDAIALDGRTIPLGIAGDVMERVAAMVPLGRIGTPEDAAGGIFLLCIPESDYVSGQVLVVGGGLRT